MRHWSARRRASEEHPGLQQVDRLVAGRPDELEVPIAGLPGQIGPFFAIYERLFKLREYRVTAVDRNQDDLWIARFTRRQLEEELAIGSGSTGSQERR